MDWKSIGLNALTESHLSVLWTALKTLNLKFIQTIQEWNSDHCWGLLYDVPNIAQPSHQWCCPCSKHHNLSPTSVDPNTFSLIPGIHPASALHFYPLCASLNHLSKPWADNLNEDAHDLCLLPPLISSHPSNRIPVGLNPCTVAEHLLLKPNNDTSCSKPNERATDEHYGCPFSNYPSSNLIDL